MKNRGGYVAEELPVRHPRGVLASRVLDGLVSLRPHFLDGGSVRRLNERPGGDWEQYCHLPDISGSGHIATPATARELWTAEFEGLHAAGGCWVLTGHPFLSGRPSRARELGELMGEVAATPGVWVASLAEIAEHTRSLGPAPRSIARPVLE